jgi:transcriptional regulator
MYIPKHYIEDDTQKLVEFIKAHSFGVMVSIVNGSPWGTHLPFVAEQKEDKIILTSHMARANEQCKSIMDNEALVIFQGPHSYISPSSYEKKLNVPTWNYVAVHAYGRPRVIEDTTRAKEVLEAMIGTYEQAYMQQWKELPADYINNMIKGIVAFDIEVTKLQGKYKLSQNKTVKEQQNIIHSLESSDDTTVSGVAKLMKERLDEQ